MLFMFFPFRDENELKYSNSYNENLSLPNVLETVNLSRIKIEPYAVLVEDALERLATNQESNIDPFGQQENEEFSERLNEDFKEINSDESFVDDDMIHADIGLSRYGSTLPLYQDSVISENICSLNAKQRKLFEVIHKWSRDYMKNLSSKTIKNIKPISKVLMYKGGHPEKPRILLLAPTGVAAINIDGTTIHNALRITAGSKLYPLNDRQRGMLQNKLAEVKFIIIDEISMVSSVLFYQVHQGLTQPANIGPQDVPRTSPTNVPRKSPKCPI